MSMEVLSEDLFLDAVHSTVAANADYVGVLAGTHANYDMRSTTVEQRCMMHAAHIKSLVMLQVLVTVFLDTG